MVRLKASVTMRNEGLRDYDMILFIGIPSHEGPSEVYHILFLEVGKNFLVASIDRLKSFDVETGVKN